MLLIFSPALVLFVIFELAAHHRQQKWGWRASLMMTGLAWGSLVVIVTELLSLNHNLDRSGVVLAWVVVLAGLLVLFAWLVHRSGTKLSDLLPARSEIIKWIHGQDVTTWVLLAALGIQVVLLAAVALTFAPNTYEDMLYQLSRVMHWFQSHSLASFATSNVREIYYPPFAEFVFLQQIILGGGGDQYVNLLQWGAFVLSLVGASAVAAELGASRNTQMAAAALSAGIPMAVLQATTARNDLVASVWLLSLVWFGLRWSKQTRSWLWAASAGLSLGLAILTKPTSFVYTVPLCLWIGLPAMKNGGIRPALLRGGLAVLLALALNLGYLVRNWGFYSDPVGIHARVRNDYMSPAVFASNTIRNVAMHVPMDCKPPLAIVNQPGRWLLAGLEQLHTLTGLSPTDPRTSWGNASIFNRSTGCIYDEHFSGNPLHALLILVTCLALPFLRTVSPRVKWFSLTLVTGFLLLNLILRWQFWGTHLQLPLFVLWAPIIAITLGRVRRPDLARLAALLAVILSFLWIYNNQMRPLSDLVTGSIPPRDEQYFEYEKVYYPDYNSMTELIARTGCDRVGLHISSLALEYPLWVLLREKGFEGVIQHVDVPNETSVFADPAFVPCAIVSEGANSDYAASMSGHSFDYFFVYLNETDVDH